MAFSRAKGLIAINLLLQAGSFPIAATFQFKNKTPNPNEEEEVENNPYEN